MTEPQRLRYRLITGTDDAEFCRRVSEALDHGYQLHGSPTLTFNGSTVIAGQALILPPEGVTDAFSFERDASSVTHMPDLDSETIAARH
jgi:hypothetical protein